MVWRGLSILNVLRERPKLTRQIAATLDVPATNLHGCLRMLAARGLITSCEGCHQISEKGAKALTEGREMTSGPGRGKAVTHHKATLRAKAWRAMRIRETFSLDDLMTLLCDCDEKDAARNLGGCIRALAAAEFLIPMRRKSFGRHPERWRLTNKGNTGPIAPSWNKSRGVVTDVNTCKVSIIRKNTSTSDKNLLMTR